MRWRRKLDLSVPHLPCPFVALDSCRSHRGGVGCRFMKAHGSWQSHRVQTKIITNSSLHTDVWSAACIDQSCTAAPAFYLSHIRETGVINCHLRAGFKRISRWLTGAQTSHGANGTVIVLWRCINKICVSPNAVHCEQQIKRFDSGDSCSPLEMRPQRHTFIYMHIYIYIYIYTRVPIYTVQMDTLHSNHSNMLFVYKYDSHLYDLDYISY